MRRRYLLTYDIADDKRRTKVMNALKDLGDHVQQSVFLAELSAAEVALLRGRLRDVLHHDADQLLLVDLGAGGSRRQLTGRIESVGKPYDPQPRVLVVG